MESDHVKPGGKKPRPAKAAGKRPRPVKPGGKKPRPAKPAKPYADFPLQAHAGRVWSKKIRGRDYYFGPWGDPMGALDRYLAQRDHLMAGVAPPESAAGITLDELINRYLSSQRERVRLAEVSWAHYRDLLKDGKALLNALGRHRVVSSLQPGDFAVLRRAISRGQTGLLSPNTIMGRIIRLKGVFNWAVESQLLIAPARYGREFRVPSKRQRVKARKERGAMDLPAAVIRQFLALCDQAKWGRLANLKAQILLGINGGLGNADCAGLRMAHLDLKAGLLTYPRPKTGVDRRAVLWPETLEAIQTVLARRKQFDGKKGIPAALGDLVFVTRRRQPYAQVSGGEKGSMIDSVGCAFNKLKRACKLRQKGLGFYSLRRTFRTIGDGTRDQPALNLIMGHAPDGSDMGAVYVQRIGLDRLAAVSEYVRAWLWPELAQQQAPGGNAQGQQEQAQQAPAEQGQPGQDAQGPQQAQAPDAQPQEAQGPQQAQAPDAQPQETTEAPGRSGQAGRGAGRVAHKAGRRRSRAAGPGETLLQGDDKAYRPR